MRGGSSAQHEVIRLIERCADHLLGRVYVAVPRVEGAGQTTTARGRGGRVKQETTTAPLARSPAAKVRPTRTGGVLVVPGAGCRVTRARLRL